MFEKKDTRGRGRRRRLQMGSAGMALALTLGAPATPELAPGGASEARAQMPSPFPPIQFGFWHVRVCLLTCYPEWALCCGQGTGPLY